MVSKSKIDINNLSYDIFELMMGYIYTGNIRITQETMLSIIGLAEQYDLNSLKSSSLDFMMKAVNKDTVIDLMADARGGKFKFKTDELITKCIEVLEEKAGDLLTGNQLNKLDEVMLGEILKSNKLNLEEIEIFNALLKWGKHKQKKGLFITNNLKVKNYQTS
jgi:hypothetical protein